MRKHAPFQAVVCVHFIESHYENLGEERCLELCAKGCFAEISSYIEDKDGISWRVYPPRD